MKKNLGDLEQLILLAVRRLGDSAYGVSIRETIQDRTGRLVSPGGIYTILARLESQGFVESRLSEATHVRGGRRRKYYQTTPEGLKALEQAYYAMINLADGVLSPPESA